MEGARRAVVRCLERANTTGAVTALAEVEPEGHVRSVRLSGPAASTAAGSCIEQVIFDVRFPRFTGQTQIVTFTFARDLR